MVMDLVSGNGMSDKLKLLAESEEGLGVIAAALQDAIAKVGDVYFDKDAQSLTLNVSRFMNEDSVNKKGAKDGLRVRCGLMLNNVLQVQMKGIERSDPSAFMVLLDVAYEAAKPKPNGIISLVFAGGGEIRAHIECLEVRLLDYQEPRATDKMPQHPDE